jgi:hypothetical protein
MAAIELDVSAAIQVAALGYYTFARWVTTITILSGGFTSGGTTLYWAGSSANDQGRTALGPPFGVSNAYSFNSLDATLSGTTFTLTLGPIDLVTPYVGTSMSSGAWAQTKQVTGSVQGSGTTLGVGLGNTILSAPNGHWYFYTVGGGGGATNSSGTGPTHTSGSAADGTATAWHGGLVSAGVPMMVTVTKREIHIGGV